MERDHVPAVPTPNMRMVGIWTSEADAGNAQWPREGFD